MSAGKSRRFNASAVITEAAVITASVSSIVTGTGTKPSTDAPGMKGTAKAITATPTDVHSRPESARSQACSGFILARATFSCASASRPSCTARPPGPASTPLWRRGRAEPTPKDKEAPPEDEAKDDTKKVDLAPITDGLANSLYLAVDDNGQAWIRVGVAQVRPLSLMEYRNQRGPQRP